VEAELDHRPGAAAVLLMIVGFQLYRLVHTVFYGQPARESWYEGPAPIAVAWLRESTAESLGVLSLVLVLTLTTSWRSFRSSPWVRPFVSSVLLLLLLSVLLTTPNALLGSAFLWDRLLLAGTFGIAFLHPVGVPIFVKEYLLLSQQLRFPDLAGYPHLHYSFFREPLVHLALAFMVTAGLRAVPWLQRVVGGNVLLMISSGSVATLYQEWLGRVTDLGPTPWAWALNDRIGNVWASAWLGGWLPWMPEGAALRVSSALDHLSPVALGAFTLAMVGAMTALWHARFAAAVFCVLTASHLGYAALSGVVLWGWIAASGLLALVFLCGGLDVQRACGLLPGAGLVVALLLPPKVSHEYELGHWNTPLVNFFQLEVVDATGASHPVEPVWLSPYDKVLALQLGLFDDRQLGHWGRTESVGLKFEIEEALRRPADARRLPPLVFGRSQPILLEAFDDLVRASVGPRYAVWRRVQGFLPLRAVNPQTPPDPLPDRPWREAVVRRRLVLRAATSFELIADDVVRRIPLAEGDERRP
jgi:hypothetical protein